MLVTVNGEERRALELALRRERVVRGWRRLKAVLLLRRALDEDSSLSNARELLHELDPK